MLHRFFRNIAPIAAIAMSAGLAGCDGMKITINDEKGVPLTDLDMAGEAPTGIVLAGPDAVIISTGTALKITVDGEQAAVDALRFSLEDGTLHIHREKDGWDNEGKATIMVTMPPPKSMSLAGSGTIESPSLAKNAKIKILGSGELKTATVDVDALDVKIAGSGSYTAAGTAKALNLHIAGSGNAGMGDLKVGGADISIAGSGDADLASDGMIKAKIMGSGDVTITGNATCNVKSMGSGSVTCQTARNETDDS